MSILGIFNRCIQRLEKENKSYKKNNAAWCKLVKKLQERIDEKDNQINNYEETLKKITEYVNTPNEVNPIAKDKLKIILGDKNNG